MKTIVDIEIVPTLHAAVTPCEMLSDFADATPGWHYLDDETRHYRAVRGVCACLLRHLRFEQPAEAIDFGFVGNDEGEQSALSLMIIDIDNPGHSLTLDLRNEEVARFAQDFQAYLSRHEGHVRVRIAEDEVELSQ